MQTSSPTTKKEAARQISIYGVGTIVRQLAAFIMLPIYTNYLTPSDYGIVSLLTLITTIFEVALGARFSQAIPKFYYENHELKSRNSVITTALFFTGLASALPIIILFSFSEFVSQTFFDSNEYHYYVEIYAFVLFTSALEAYGLSYFRILEKPILFVCNSIAKLILQLSLNIYFVVHQDLGVLGVVYSTVISSSAFGGFALCYILYNAGCRFNFAQAKKMFAFSWPLWIGGFAGMYVGASSRLFIKFFGDLSEVGIFELAFKLSTVLGILVWNPFTQWWQTERFKLYNSPDKGITVFPLVFNVVASVLVIVAGGLIIFSDIVIRIMADDLFHSAILAMPVLVLANFFGLLCNFHKFSFFVSGKTLTLTYFGYFRAIVLTLFSLILIPTFGFMGAAIAIAISNIINYSLLYIFSKSEFDCHINHQHFVRLMFVLTIVSIVSFCLSEIIDYLVPLLILKSLIAVSLLFIVIFILYKDRNIQPHLKSIINAVFRKFRKP